MCATFLNQLRNVLHVLSPRTGFVIQASSDAGADAAAAAAAAVSRC